MSVISAGLFARGPVAAEVSDRALLRAMLDFELALIRALVHVGRAPVGAAQELAAVVDQVSGEADLAELARCTGAHGTPVPALLAAVRHRLSPEAGSCLHLGATSQDVVDTALMLVAKRALAPLLEDVSGALDACAAMTQAHRTTIVAGRTLLQQALPLTFGLKAAVWLDGLRAARDDLVVVREQVLAVQLGGAVGTLAALGDNGLEVVAAVARELGLTEPVVPWHTIRARPARLAGALACAAGVMGKVARDVTLLAQSEVAEVSEGGESGRGGSSTLPQKRNPIGAVTVLACAQRAPGLAATMLSAMVQEHERATGGWQAEWDTLTELLRVTGSAANASRELLEGLTVDPARMRGNLDEQAMSESVVAALSASIDRVRAQALVREAALAAAGSRGSLRGALLDVPEVRSHLGERGLDEALDPERYLGVAQSLIDRALTGYRS